MTILVELVLGICDHVTLQRSASRRFCHLQCMKLEDFTLLVKVGSLGAPQQFHVAWQYALCNFRIDNLVNLCSVACSGISNNAEALTL